MTKTCLYEIMDNHNFDTVELMMAKLIEIVEEDKITERKPAQFKIQIFNNIIKGLIMRIT